MMKGCVFAYHLVHFKLLSCVNQFGYGCSYYKLLGDGALVIWDETTPTTLGEAIMVFQTYTEFLGEELFSPYPELGLGGALVMEKYISMRYLLKRLP